MKSHSHKAGALRFGIVGAALIAALVAAAAIPLSNADAGQKASKIWRKVAGKLRSSAKAEAKADYQLALARALAITNENAHEDALDEAKEDYKEEKGLASDAYKARLELAIRLNEDELYTVDVNPANFVQGINHPFLPYTPGIVLTYEGEVEEGTETIVVKTLAETKEILGVTCTVVQDTVTLDGEVIEDTFDWFAQDVDGNVWYFGEASFEYEDGELVGSDGSWISGREGAQPGIVMQAVPTVGQIYRQEFWIGEAEDWAEVLATDATAITDLMTYTNCVQTLDALPFEPDVIEHKYYAQGIGLVLENKPEDGERIELISIVNTNP